MHPGMSISVVIMPVRMVVSALLHRCWLRMRMMPAAV
jgi:hypothetical protein